MMKIQCNICQGSGRLNDGTLCSACDGIGELVSLNFTISQQKLNDFMLFSNRLRHDSFMQYADPNHKEAETGRFKRDVYALGRQFQG